MCRFSFFLSRRPFSGEPALSPVKEIQHNDLEHYERTLSITVDVETEPPLLEHYFP
jgi:hypothetical protein